MSNRRRSLRLIQKHSKQGATLPNVLVSRMLTSPQSNVTSKSSSRTTSTYTENTISQNYTCRISVRKSLKSSPLQQIAVTIPWIRLPLPSRKLTSNPPEAVSASKSPVSTSDQAPLDALSATPHADAPVTSPSPGHIKAAKHIVKYLKGTSTHGIMFHSSHDKILQSFLQFPQPFKQHLTGISDANWGAQDQSTSYQSDSTLELHKSRSISGAISYHSMDQYTGPPSVNPLLLAPWLNQKSMQQMSFARIFFFSLSSFMNYIFKMTS